MYQINFSEQSISIVNKMPVPGQLKLMEELGGLEEKKLESGKDFGRFNRGKQVYYRVRLDDLRIYFEKNEKDILVHYILLKHTWNDFLFRSNLPFSDDKSVENDTKFWEYLESLKK